MDSEPRYCQAAIYLGGVDTDQIAIGAARRMEAMETHHENHAGRCSARISIGFNQYCITRTFNVLAYYYYVCKSRGQHRQPFCWPAASPDSRCLADRPTAVQLGAVRGRPVNEVPVNAAASCPVRTPNSYHARAML